MSPEMQCIAKLCDIESPSYIVPCSGTKEHAYVVSLKTDQFWKRSWFNASGEEDSDKIDLVNSGLPDCPELTEFFTGKLDKKLSEYYLGSKVIGFEDQIILDRPDAIFLQRVSARTKTFDMVFFYGTDPKTFSVVDKSDLDTIRDWFTGKIYSCGADPLPIKYMEKWMSSNNRPDMYEEIYNKLFDQEESSCSEYEPESDPESEDESCVESEDEIEDSEESCIDESDSDGDYEPETKKRKI